MKSLKGYLLILAATTFWGVAATIAKFLFTHDVDTLTLVQLRMTFSCIILLLYFLIFKRHLLKVQFRDLYKFAMLGILGAAGSNFTYYYTIAATNVATAILLQYLAPLLVLLYAVITREEKITAVKTTASIISLGGCYLAVAGKDFSIISINQLGLLTGIASAFCWGFTNIWLKRLLKQYNVWTCLVYAFLFASIFWAIINPPWNILSAGYSGETWGIFFGFAMISILIPHSLYFSGMRYLTASRAIITATFEPIVAIISAYFIVQEVLSAVQIAGAVLVLLAIGILQLRQEENR
jgi:drug/metabolite transporter (DMT)-like permease